MKNVVFDIVINSQFQAVNQVNQPSDFVCAKENELNICHRLIYWPGLLHIPLRIPPPPQPQHSQLTSTTCAKTENSANIILDNDICSARVPGWSNIMVLNILICKYRNGVDIVMYQLFSFSCIYWFCAAKLMVKLAKISCSLIASDIVWCGLFYLQIWSANHIWFRGIYILRGLNTVPFFQYLTWLSLRFPPVFPPIRDSQI